MKLNKKIKGEAQSRVVRGPKIWIERLKDRQEQLRYQCRIRQKKNRLGTNEGYRGQVEGESVEKTWAEFKECILSAAVEVCGMRRRKNQQKRTSWWNNEVREAVKEKKIAYLGMDAAEDIRG